ncbi:ubiquitin carboxyl-terminal hydrolase 47-like isoform X1 [Salmo trutta]|uniref:ubiquitin carboxyl-terminal hydrolase 47-like isoform X1 n=1 Tax=Salmo trutta TaxID=8032 RepID=UPI0011328136|nr:ubiquitin carboxyl-terminal hydrolase 47-like isoform X1 [Salmo trutta]
MNSKENPKKKECDKGILKKFKMRLDLIFDYNGLVNQGATCYLNSVLQVLFMTKDFREAVERFGHCGQDQKTADFHLKSLFKTLKTSETHTKDILSILGIGNVYEQRDAAEYFENILSMVSPCVSKIFKGHLRHTMRCSEGHVTNDETGPFWTLPLSMENPSNSNKTYSVREGFEEFFKSSTVGGMYCDQCNEKTDSTIACKMEHPPEILTLLLKRFEFDYRRMSYVKNDCCVDVPHTLRTKDCDYELYAVVDHVGSLRGGHYTAKIKSYQNHNWYVFDDSYVTQPNPQSISHMNNERSQSVYLLMYKKSHAPDELREEEMKKKEEELKCMEEEWKKIEEELRILNEEWKKMKEELKRIINVESRRRALKLERIYVEFKTCVDNNGRAVDDIPQQLMTTRETMKMIEEEEKRINGVGRV